MPTVAFRPAKQTVIFDHLHNLPTAKSSTELAYLGSSTMIKIAR